MFITTTQFNLAQRAMKIATDSGLDVSGIKAIDLHNYVVSGYNASTEKGGFFHVYTTYKKIRPATYDESGDYMSSEVVTGWA